jgi:hypothetical protein
MNPDMEEALDHMVAHFRQENWLPKLFVRERPDHWQALKTDTLEQASFIKETDGICIDIKGESIEIIKFWK